MASISLPLGCKFQPKDHQLLVYLSRKANGEALPCDGLIREIDLYRLSDPGKLFQRTEEEEEEEEVVYVFTKLKKVSRNGKRIDRCVSGNRTWKGVDGGHPVRDRKGRVVGEKKNFVLMNKMKMKLGYNMTEFSLDKNSLRNSTFKDYVVCQIKKKAKKSRSSTDGNLPEEDIRDNSFSMLEIEGEGMTYSGGNSTASVESQDEQAQHWYQFPEEGTTDLMTMLCGDFDNDKALISLEPSAEEYHYQQEESDEVWGMIKELSSIPISISWGDISCSATALPMSTVS